MCFRLYVINVGKKGNSMDRLYFEEPGITRKDDAIAYINEKSNTELGIPVAE